MSNNPKTLLVSHPMVQLILYTKAVYWQNCQQKNRFQMDSQFPAKKSIKIMSITLDGLPCKWTPNMAFYFEWIQTFLEHNLRWEIKDELIQSGILGDIRTVRLWKTGGSPKITKSKVQSIPSSLNWDMWQGPAPAREYFPERCHFNYRYFLDYSGGMFADFWCHIADVVYMSLRPKELRSISARGEEAKGLSDTRLAQCCAPRAQTRDRPGRPSVFRRYGWW